MEEVIDDLGVWAVLPDLQIEGGVHVHGDGLDLPATVFAEQLKEGADGFTAAAFAAPEDSHALGIHDDCGVAMPLVQGKLIHNQALDTAGSKFAKQPFQALIIDRLDGVPVQPSQLRHMGNRQHLGQRFDPGPEPVGHPASPV